MTQQFMFIEGLQADMASKKLMRRHVMRGKNAGKKLQRPSRQAAALQPYRHHPDQQQQQEKHKALTRFRTLDKSSQLSDYAAAMLAVQLLWWPFAPGVVVKPGTLQIVQTFFVNVSDRLYPARLGLSMHQIKTSWFRQLLTDMDAQTCCVAVMQACNELFLGHQPTSQSLYSLAHTLRVVNRRVQGRDALSNATIAIVLSLIGHEQIKNEHAAAAVHTQGLGRMVQLRGGLDRLDTEGNLALVLKICKTDIMFALQHGGPAMFFRDSMPKMRVKLASSGLSLDANDGDADERGHTTTAAASAAVTTTTTGLRLPQTDQLDPSLASILHEVMSVCDLINTKLNGETTIDCLDYLDIVVSLLYRLLRCRSLSDTTSGSSAARAYHVGMVMVVALMLMHRGPRNIIICEPVSQSITALCQLADITPQLKFWVMFMGAIWHGNTPGGAPLRHQAASGAAELQLRSWDAARACLARFPWLAGIHDAPGRELWDQLPGQQYLEL